MYKSLPKFKIDRKRNEKMFETYTEEIRPIFSTDIDHSDIDYLNINLECYNAGRFVFGKSLMEGSNFRYKRDMRKIAATDLDLILVQIILHGSDRRTYGKVEHVTEPGDVCIADLTRPFSTSTRSCQNYSFVVPRQIFGSEEELGDRLHGMHLPRNSLEADFLKRHMHSLWAMTPRLTLSASEGLAMGTVRLFAELVGNQSRQNEEGGAIDTAILIRVRSYINANLRDPYLAPGTISKVLGLSRSSLFKIMEPLGGVSTYIRRRRLRRAFLALVEDAQRTKSIGEIAMDWCFHELSTFYRAFRAEFGISPGEVREAGFAALMLTKNPDPGEALLPAWLRVI